MKQKPVKISDDCVLSNSNPMVIIAGPCALESRELAINTAKFLSNLCKKLGIKLIFKSSFDKANRTSFSGRRGIGLKQAIDIFKEIRQELNLPIITDIHESYQADLIAPYVDILQIPAFLCRQTDLLKAAADTGCAVNVKKGQFLSGWDMENICKKLESFNCEKIILTERGSSFGYNNLIVDMRGLLAMSKSGYPVVMDATHSVQRPGGQGSSSGGDREFVAPLARAAVSLGVSAVFIETHPEPEKAYSDGANMIPLHRMEELLKDLKTFDDLAKSCHLPDIK